MYQRAFVTVSDGAYFTGLWALLNSIYAYYECEYRVIVVGHNLRPASVQALRNHPLGSAITLLDSGDFAYPTTGTWEAKQCVLSHLCGTVATACLLDADLVLLSRLDDVFESGEQGRIVTSRDGIQDRYVDESHRVYGESLIGSHHPYFNSGFLCLNLIRHWDLAALWEFTSRFAAYSPGGGPPYGFPGHGDQGLLNSLAVLLRKTPHLDLLPQSPWCNSAGWTVDETVDIVSIRGLQLDVEHRRLRAPQRLLHSTGPKWWRSDGRAHFLKSGDVQACFEHFANLFSIEAESDRNDELVSATDWTAAVSH